MARWRGKWGSVRDVFAPYLMATQASIESRSFMINPINAERARMVTEEALGRLLKK